jgi:hypothetical protein
MNYWSVMLLSTVTITGARRKLNVSGRWCDVWIQAAGKHVNLTFGIVNPPALLSFLLKYPCVPN